MPVFALLTLLAGVSEIVVLFLNPTRYEVKVITSGSTAITLMMIFVAWRAFNATSPDEVWGYTAAVAAIVHAMAVGGGLGAFTSWHHDEERRKI